MNTPAIKWKPNDWCFFEHALHMVKEVEPDGRVTEVSNGSFSTSSSDLRDRMFQLDLRGKCISDAFEREYNRPNEGRGTINLNFPDIHRWFVEKWANCMEKRDDDDVACKAIIDELYEFVQKVFDFVRESSAGTVCGVRMIR